MSTRARRRAGFTLIEILVVVAVVAVLALTCFSVFARAREKARAATCTGNLKQIALAMQLYLQDSDGRFPSVSTGYPAFHPAVAPEYRSQWLLVLEPYIKGNAVFRCPTSQVDKERRDTDYKYNASRLSDVVFRVSKGYVLQTMVGKHESRMLRPSTTILNQEHNWRIVSSNYADYYVYGGEPIAASCGLSDEGSTLHAGGGNYSFLDGHVKWLSPLQKGEMECDNFRARKQG